MNQQCDRCGQQIQGDAVHYRDRNFCSQDCLSSFKRDEAGASR
ncbi:MAG: TRASH domain-containing protein [Dehalococcoidia bacterium]|nr:TRASH domain-containing protein [Dehalococcoidia bacterium]